MDIHPEGEERATSALNRRLYGMYAARVTDNRDPDAHGRVRIALPAGISGGHEDVQVWARVAVPMAGDNRGIWFLPDVDDEVLVGFEAGEVRRPYVVGGLWKSSDAPPEAMDAGGRNFKKVIRSRNGVTITLDDSDGSESVVLATPAGQKITLSDGPPSIVVQDAHGNVVKLEPTGVTVHASGRLTLAASMVELDAGQLTVNAAMSRFAGVLQADTIIANNVIANSVAGASYTPGAGNLR